jgi:hypothetical protein
MEEHQGRIFAEPCMVLYFTTYTRVVILWQSLEDSGKGSTDSGQQYWRLENTFTRDWKTLLPAGGITIHDQGLVGGKELAPITYHLPL